MSLDSTTQTINAYVQALLSGGDFAQYFTDDVRWTTMESGEEISGRKAVGDYIGSMHTTLYDAHPEVKKVAIADGIVAAEFDFTGTNTGEFEGVPPTGEQLRIPYSMFYDVGDNGISHLRAYIPITRIMAVFRAQ